MWPILEKHVTSDQLRSAAVTIRTSFGPLLVFGSVLPWRSDGAYAPLNGTEAFLRALDSQAKDWKKLRQKNRNCEFCLAGDFNQELSGSIFVGSKVGQSALENALKQADLECQTSGSDDPVFQLTTQITSSIDHVCLSKELASRVKRKPEAWPKADKPDKNLSDHFCVYIDILDNVAVNKYRTYPLFVTKNAVQITQITDRRFFVTLFL